MQSEIPSKTFRKSLTKRDTEDVVPHFVKNTWLIFFAKIINGFTATCKTSPKSLFRALFDHPRKAVCRSRETMTGMNKHSRHRLSHRLRMPVPSPNVGHSAKPETFLLSVSLVNRQILRENMLKKVKFTAISLWGISNFAPKVRRTAANMTYKRK